ncbi:hypothetical protein [Cohnella mopanensis]|uniref:hypothetical protein n=1 Tax=Cohnella mopanensis TaxID=2911966 RepID=UPI001EF8B34B|nr:hypothetical protein [Cohnella mopanensis]
MKPFPEECEFIDLFETEPHLLDPDSPFFYNHLTYMLERANGIIYFELEPGCHSATFIWKDKNDKTIVDLDLRNIKGLEIEKRNGLEFLRFLFHEDQELKDLIIKTKPEISVLWGTEGF